MEQLAINFATEKHKLQKRKFNNEPYVNHPIRVSNIVREFSSDEKLITVAVLHDTIEDTNATIKEITEKFGLEVANLVSELTNNKDELQKLGKTTYMANKFNSLSESALLVKLADRLDNVSDLSHDNEIWSMQYATQTEHILHNLSNPNINDNHRALILRIRNKLELFFNV